MNNEIEIKKLKKHIIILINKLQTEKEKIDNYITSISEKEELILFLKEELTTKIEFEVKKMLEKFRISNHRI